MIEQGFVELIQSNAAVKAIAAEGGFLAQLPSDLALPSWSYLVVSEVSGSLLSGPETLGSRRIQVDCYGATADDTLALAAAIDAVLDGYRGTLTDPDATFVQGIFHLNTIDIFDPDARSFRRMLEYFVWSG
ncbi:MAG TPA: hypothetical protein VGP83_16935 [Pyrinomonadaceae bacterium]|jgi:hypothetical protein|nr:hypothetical protein [Pyrinomonadaceae bacterium]